MVSAFAGEPFQTDPLTFLKSFQGVRCGGGQGEEAGGGRKEMVLTSSKELQAHGSTGISRSGWEFSWPCCGTREASKILLTRNRGKVGRSIASCRCPMFSIVESSIAWLESVELIKSKAGRFSENTRVLRKAYVRDGNVKQESSG